MENSNARSIRESFNGSEQDNTVQEQLVDGEDHLMKQNPITFQTTIL
jgi:hypothetical protein